MEEQLEEEIKRKDVALQQIHNALRADIRIEDAELQTKDAALKVEVQSREAALLQGCSIRVHNGAPDGHLFTPLLYAAKNASLNSKQWDISN